jgi:hypothetical protein
LYGRQGLVGLRTRGHWGLGGGDNRHFADQEIKRRRRQIAGTRIREEEIVLGCGMGTETRDQSRKGPSYNAEQGSSDNAERRTLDRGLQITLNRGLQIKMNRGLQITLNVERLTGVFR